MRCWRLLPLLLLLMVDVNDVCAYVSVCSGNVDGRRELGLSLYGES